MILGLVEENSWPLDGIIRNEVLETLNDVVPIVILNHLLDWYTCEVDNPIHDGGLINSAVLVLFNSPKFVFFLSLL